MQPSSEDHFSRRFGGIARLYGEAALARFQAAHIAVIGIGGVGSWAAEALARSAIGRLTLIDLDHVGLSNVNRQIHALDGEFGKAKVTAMAERIRLINPTCTVIEIEEFVSEDNLEALLNQGYDYVIDAIDHVRTKAALITYCKRQKIKLISVGGAGGRIDPTQIQTADLSRTTGDPLLAKVRYLLRRQYGFSRDTTKKMGVDCVFSSEAVTNPRLDMCETDLTAKNLTGLNCAGYGSVMTVTASFGLVAVAKVLKQLARLIEKQAG